MFKKNMCVIDQIIRGVVGLILIATAFLFSSVYSSATLFYLVLGFGLLNILSAGPGYCPIYAVSSFSTLLDDNDIDDPASPS
jgi:hypothetical protein